MLAKVGVHVTKHTSEGQFPTRYAVYHPPAAAEGEKGPMLLLFHPGGNGVDRIYFYIEAAAGGWLGPKDRFPQEFPPMRVAMVNGGKDRAANAYLERDMNRLTLLGSTVSVHAFEGGLQMPPPSVQEKAMRWLLEK